MVFSEFRGFCFCFVSLCFVWALKFFLTLQVFWLLLFRYIMVSGFVFLGDSFVCEYVCLCAYACFFCLFFDYPFFYSFCFVLFRLVCYYFTLLYYFSSFFLDAYFLIRVRKDVDSGGWEDLGGIGERINCNENICIKIYF